MSNGTKQRLLQAGRDILLEIGYKVLDRGLTVESIAERAGTSSQTFFNTYPRHAAKGTEGGKERFIRDLVESLGAATPRGARQVLQGRIREELIDKDGDPLPVVRALAEEALDELEPDPAIRFRWFVAIFGRDHEQAMAAARREYRAVTELNTAAYDELLKRWGATPRMPFTCEDIAVTLSSLVEGFVLRRIIDPDTASTKLFGHVVVALAAALVDVEQKNEHIDDLLKHVVAEVKARYAAQGHVAIPIELDTVIEAAREQLDKRNYFQIRLPHIAAAAKVSPSSLKSIYPRVEDIIVAALKPRIEQLRNHVDANRTAGLAEPVILRSYLRKLAHLAHDEAAFVDALIVSTAGNRSSGMSELDLSGIIEPVIKEGQEKGNIASDRSPEELATSLTRVLLVECHTYRHQSPPPAHPRSPDDLAESVANMCLDGLQLTPPSTER